MMEFREDSFLTATYTMKDVKATKDLVTVGDYVFTPTSHEQSPFKFELGKVIAKSTHCFVVESLFAKGVRSAFAYVDLLLNNGAPVVTPEVTGLSHSVALFKPVEAFEAFEARDFMRRTGVFGGVA